MNIYTRFFFDNSINFDNPMAGSLFITLQNLYLYDWIKLPMVRYELMINN